VSNIPARYFVQGQAAAEQLASLGSEPGEKDYNRLWIELFVKWNPGMTPVLLTSDDQINSLASAHKLTVTDAPTSASMLRSRKSVARARGSRGHNAGSRGQTGAWSRRSWAVRGVNGAAADPSHDRPVQT
jgi:hypothetical protein